MRERERERRAIVKYVKLLLIILLDVYLDYFEDIPVPKHDRYNRIEQVQFYIQFLYVEIQVLVEHTFQSFVYPHVYDFS